MKVRTEAEIEEALFQHQTLALAIGMAIVMMIAWLTLPSDLEQKANKTCLQQCKEVINSGNVGKLSVFSGPTYFEEMGKCHRECTREKDENID